MPSKAKGASFLEKKRERERKIKHIIESKQNESDSDNKDLAKDPEKILPRFWIQLAQYTLIFIFGSISIYGLFALCFYLADMMADSFVDDLAEMDEITDYLIVFLVLAIIFGSLVGCFITFKFGTISSNLQRLRNASRQIANDVKDFKNMREHLKGELKELKNTLKSINSEKNELKKCTANFDRLNDELQKNDIYNEVLTDEIDSFSNELKDELDKLRKDNERASILKKFYEKQGADDADDGLNRNEFEWLKAELDDDIAQRFPPFEYFDADGDGNVDIFEFDNVLDEIYSQINQDRKHKIEHQKSQHYIEKNKDYKNRLRANTHDDDIDDNKSNGKKNK